jgi:hypothetical protein
MALQAAVGRGNNPFIGGSKTPNAPPPAMRGSIAPANTGVSSPEGGVSPGQPMFARNNRGSNIGIPYTRIVPLGNARFGLEGEPYTQGSQTSIHDKSLGSGTQGLKATVITETEDLRATRVGFIHGRRRRDGGMEPFERGQDVNGMRGTNQQFMLAPGMPGTERFQKLCSIEYLQRYFKHAFRPGVATIELGRLVLPNGMDGNGNAGGVTAAQAPWWTAGLLRMVLRHTDTQQDNAGGVLATLDAIPTQVNADGTVAADTDCSDGAHAGAIGDLGKAFGLPGSPMLNDAAGNPTPTLRQGIFAMDTGPFLRGKGGASSMLRCTKYTGAPQKVGNGRAVQVFHSSRCLGDEVAFEMLERAFEDLGLTDWRPDGIVLSKGANDPSDKLSDESFDVRDGQLYNMRIQGPALSTTWTGDPALEVMPLDKVFIVIVADVWFDGLPDEMEKYVRKTAEGAPAVDSLKLVEDELTAAATAIADANADIETAKAAIATAEADIATAAGLLSTDPTKAGAAATAAAAKTTADTDLSTAQGDLATAVAREKNAYKAADAQPVNFSSMDAYLALKRRMAAYEAAISALQVSRGSPAIDFETTALTANDIKTLADDLKNDWSSNYKKIRDAELRNDAITRKTLGAFVERGASMFKDADSTKKTVLTNFRVRTATSSQMINYSPLRFNTAGGQDVDVGDVPDEFRKVYYSSRMGLALTDDMGEYIVGGWCIGNVLDTSASRAVMPGAGSNIGVRTAPNSMAHNINVQIEWWDADRMWRSFCNVQDKDAQPTLTPRHQQSWPQNAGQGLLPKDEPPVKADGTASATSLANAANA